MRRAISIFGVVALVFALAPAAQARSDGYTPGAAGVGDPYFPLDGNGGYDVQRYRLKVQYDPASGVLSGVATIVSIATQGLSRFDLDLVGLTVRSIEIDGDTATWTRDKGELIVTPPTGIADGARFNTVVTYDGVPEGIEDALGTSGFMPTDDGALILGEPHVAATWFPANDHPIDPAAFTFIIRVPKGLEAVANGTLERVRTNGRWTTWRWEAHAPMTTYLAGVGIGRFDIRAYTVGGIHYWDAIDPDLLGPVAEPRTGNRFAISQRADSSYKRLTRAIRVPAGGAKLAFWVDRDTEPTWDFFFVEARTVGGHDWTTLPDENGHTSQSTENPCPYLLVEHPRLRHYLTASGDTCAATGTTGGWWAASGTSDGWEHWVVDLSRWAGSRVSVSLTYASDFTFQQHGVFVDDIRVSAGAGSTSFEADGDLMDGWSVPGPPASSPGNANDWIVGTAADGPPNFGTVAEPSLARQPEILDFEADVFGPYPFTSAGGVIDDAELSFALENQTRVFYSKYFFFDRNDGVMVHELAHQWFGDNLPVQMWRDVWLNEGFASYAEWLWSEHEGGDTPDQIFNFYYDVIPSEDPFWSLAIGDPGPDHLFDGAVYIRGAMTLQALRREVGDKAFFQILRGWANQYAGENVNTQQFIALSEKISGQQLDGLFDEWLFTGAKPVIDTGDTARIASRAGEFGGLGISVGTLHRIDAMRR